jgi:hypothetical protein
MSRFIPNPASAAVLSLKEAFGKPSGNIVAFRPSTKIHEDPIKLPCTLGGDLYYFPSGGAVQAVLAQSDEGPRVKITSFLEFEPNKFRAEEGINPRVEDLQDFGPWLHDCFSEAKEILAQMAAGK